TSQTPAEEHENDEEIKNDEEDDEVEEVEIASRRLTVLIYGGGIAGLMLALLLCRARVPFLVLERAKEVKPLGLGDMIAPLFKQLGIFEEFIHLAKRLNHCQMYNENLKPIKLMDMSLVKDMYVVGNRFFCTSFSNDFDLL
ncbi:hypothetical protein BGZ94_005948, partial [Podila epigama]